jgi:hypothetical protein
LFKEVETCGPQSSIMVAQMATFLLTVKIPFYIYLQILLR